MDNIALGQKPKGEVVMNSRNLLSEQLAGLLPHSEEVKDALADAVAADAMWALVLNAVRICNYAPRKKHALCLQVALVGLSVT